MQRWRHASVALAVAASFVVITLLVVFPAPIPEGDRAAHAKAVKAPTITQEVVEPADNSYCMVCHLNYENEKLTKVHRVAAIGCEKCHGPSEEHSGDEDGLTPPEIMYAECDIDQFCLTCHPKDKLSRKEHLEDVFSPMTDDHLVCTECHGENHRMAVRTRVWDKKTRKLISDDGTMILQVVGTLQAEVVRERRPRGIHLRAKREPLRPLRRAPIQVEVHRKPL